MSAIRRSEIAQETVDGFVEAAAGKRVASIYGKLDDCLHYAITDGTEKPMECGLTHDASLLWKKNTIPVNVTRYNLTSFAITLNEITPALQEKLPPTDSRFRPDQRYLENGEYEKANSEKQGLEKRQRMSSKLQECGWKPKWFQQENENGLYRYIGVVTGSLAWTEDGMIVQIYLENLMKTLHKRKTSVGRE